jgi:hypothetical protein
MDAGLLLVVGVGCCLVPKSNHNNLQWPDQTNSHQHAHEVGTIIQFVFFQVRALSNPTKPKFHRPKITMSSSCVQPAR